MRCHPILPVLALLTACFAILPAALPAAPADRGPTTGVAVADQAGPGGDHRCRVRVIKDGGDAETVEIDLSGIGEAIGAAMEEVSRALAELDTVQVVSERHGKRLTFREDGHEAVIDLDAIMGEVHAVLAGALAEVDDHAHAGSRHATDRGRHEARAKVRHEVREGLDDGQQALRVEIDSLRRELADLQAELRALRAQR